MVMNQMMKRTKIHSTSEQSDGKLKRYGSVPFTLGYTTSVGERDASRFFRGDIAKVMLWNRKLNYI